MNAIHLAHFEHADLDGDVLSLKGQDKDGNPIVITLGMQQYAALTMDVGFTVAKAKPLRQTAQGLQEQVVIQATEAGLSFDILRNDPILVFRHGQGRQSAFLVPRTKAKSLAEMLLSRLEPAPQPVPPSRN